MMERGYVVVLVALAVLNADATLNVRHNTTTEFFIDQYGVNVRDLSLRQFQLLLNTIQEASSNVLQRNMNFNLTPLPLTQEILHYLRFIVVETLLEFTTDLSNMTAQSIYQNRNEHCGEYLETLIVDLRVEPSNVTRFSIQLRKTLRWKLKMYIDFALHKCTSEQKRMSLCKKVQDNCTSFYEGGARKLLSSYVEEGAELPRDLGSTPLEITTQFLLEAGVLTTIPYSSINNFLIIIAYYTSAVPSIEPFAIGNLIQPKTNKEVEKAYLLNYTTIQSLEKFSWGIVKSDAGSVGYTCSSYKDRYSEDSEEYSEFLKVCRFNNAAKLNLDWSTVASVYFHSQCLCLA